MKCTYHPQKEAVNKCSMCKKPLCAECGEQEAGANVLCTRCAALSAAQAAVIGEEERQTKQEEKRITAAKKRKKPHAGMIAVLIAAAIVLLANVYMYIGPGAPVLDEFDPGKHPVLAADLINDGIEDYAEDHGGQFPEKLTDLLEKYLPYEKITPAVLDIFSYTRFSPTSYELRFNDEGNEEFSDIVFGKENK